MNTDIEVLSHIEVNPEEQPRGTVIWLHGLGADGHDFAPFVSELNLIPNHPIRFIFPHAPMRPITINNGYVMRGWYDITSLTKMEGHVDQQGINDSVDHLTSFIEREEARGIPSNKIVLAGFSQGALITLVAGLRCPKRLGGLLALSGYIPFTEADLLTQANDANKDTPIFCGHGMHDTIVPYMLGLISYETLKKHGFAPVFHTYPIAHSVSEQEISDIAKWLNKIFTA